MTWDACLINQHPVSESHILEMEEEWSYKNFSKPYTRFCKNDGERKRYSYSLSHQKDKTGVDGYLEAHDLSDGQDQSWHETLHISDIMFKKVDLWQSSIYVLDCHVNKVKLYKSQTGGVKAKAHLSWAGEVDCCAGSQSWKD